MDKHSKALYSTAVSVALSIVCYLLVLAVSNDNQHTWDMTANKRFTFSDQTNSVVKNLDAPVKLYAFLDPVGNTKMIQGTLERYRALNAGMFTFEIVDKDKQPTLAARMEVRNHGQGVLELVGSELTNKDGLPRRERVTSFDETGITNALLKLARTETRVVYFLQAQDTDLGPKRGMSELSKGLALEGFEARTLNLIQTEKLPLDMDVLVIPGPDREFGGKELALIESYLQEGGKLLFLADFRTPTADTEWLKKYGFDVQSTLIVDRASQMVKQDDATYAVGFSEFSNHPVSVASRVQTGLPLTRPIVLVEPEGLKGGGAPVVEVLLQTAATAVASPYDPSALEKIDIVYSPDQAKDSLVVAAAGVYPRTPGPAPSASPSPEPKASPDGEKLPAARIVVVGNLEGFSDKFLELAGNRDFILNAINWLAESENQITMRVKNQRNQPLMLQKNQFTWLLFLFCILIPMLSTITGLMMSYQRSRGMTE